MCVTSTTPKKHKQTTTTKTALGAAQGRAWLSRGKLDPSFLLQQSEHLAPTVRGAGARLSFSLCAEAASGDLVTLAPSSRCLIPKSLRGSSPGCGKLAEAPRGHSQLSEAPPRATPPDSNPACWRLCAPPCQFRPNLSGSPAPHAHRSFPSLPGSFCFSREGMIFTNSTPSSRAPLAWLARAWVPGDARSCPYRLYP